ncbi:hypothetical protein FGO68_gene4403 [Halteria grandinella]|uniref:General transcription factor IIH subunit n=1 Tax=Halteria grandinella TaxID=5974 RepID=A0A8J8NR51_HALGN|nr:hypothetical protein FGO68_gene4403 [Halteria grandinella]
MSKQEKPAQTQHTWTGDYKARTWAKLADDSTQGGLGDLQQSLTDKKLTKKLAIDTFNASVKRKSLIRYLTVIVDFSSAARRQEMRPNRAIVIKSYLAEFIRDFFDINPLSQISFIVTYKEKAVLLTDFADSPIEHINKLLQFQDFEGNASLQNALDIAVENFSHPTVPTYAHKEVLVIFSSITNCDPGNIFDTFAQMYKQKIQGSVISLSAAIYMLQKLADTTRGEFMLSKSQQHFQELLKRCLIPRESIKMQQLQGQQQEGVSNAQLIKMGFPERVAGEKIPVYCMCHNESKFFYYRCPNCQAPQCELSAACKICKVLLVSAVHLARTTQSREDPLLAFEGIKDYLKPEDQPAVIEEETSSLADPIPLQVNPSRLESLVKENNWSTSLVGLIRQQQADQLRFNCSGCDKLLQSHIAEVNDIVVCGGCKKLYCLDCDIFIHETLLSCPTCVK